METSRLVASVLAEQPLFLLIAQFQFGVFLDVRHRFAEAKHMVSCLLVFQGYRVQEYTFPRTFRRADLLHNNRLDIDHLCLHDQHIDTRLPLHFAIFEGDLTAAKRIIHCRPDLLTRDALRCATKHNRLAIVQLLLTMRDRYLEDETERIDSCRTQLEVRKTTLLDAAAGIGNLDLIHQFVHLGLDECSDYATYISAVKGHLHVIKYLHVHRPEAFTAYTLDGASYGRHLEVIRFLLEHRQEGCSTQAGDAIMTFCDLPVAQMLVGRRLTTWTMDHWHETNRDPLDPLVNNGRWISALSKGRVDDLKSFVEGHGRAGKLTKLVSVATVDVIEYLSSIDCPLDKLQPATVAVARALHAHGVDFSAMNFSVAAKTNNVDLLAFLHTLHPDISLPLDLIETAAGRGHLDLVRYLYENGLGRSTTAAMSQAARNGHLEVVKFLSLHRPEGCNIESAMAEAARSGHLDVVQFLNTSGYEDRDEFILIEAIENGQTDVATYLYENGYEVDDPTSLLMELVHWNVLAGVEWLLDRYPKADISETFVSAARLGYVAVLEAITRRQRPVPEKCLIHATYEATGDLACYAVAWLWNLCVKQLSPIQLHDVSTSILKHLGDHCSCAFNPRQDLCVPIVKHTKHMKPILAPHYVEMQRQEQLRKVKTPVGLGMMDQVFHDDECFTGILSTENGDY
ncbi:hypothetical protein LEN26_013550 [Aphanomyces euteiches]|nr:hypothetical protein LEN26_013550 [Aphanomyces euteiches]